MAEAKQKPATAEMTIQAGSAIVAAIVAVQKEINQVQRDANNPHASYSYASIDAFYRALGPLMATHGLAVVQSEEDFEIVTVEVTRNRERVAKQMIRVTYVFRILHVSGAISGADLGLRRTVTIEMAGPQQWGSAQSYAHKMFLRSLFMVPTGEADADDERSETVETVEAILSPEESAARADKWIKMISDLSDADEVAAAFETLKSYGRNMALADKNRCVAARDKRLKELEAKEPTP